MAASLEEASRLAQRPPPADYRLVGRLPDYAWAQPAEEMALV